MKKTLQIKKTCDFFRGFGSGKELVDLCEEREGFAPSVQRQASGDVIVDQPLSCQFARMDLLYLYDIWN